jgi:hypothetical protein
VQVREPHGTLQVSAAYLHVTRLGMPAPLAAAVAAVPWLLSTAVCTFIALYALTVLVALLHPDQARRADARAVLRLYPHIALIRLHLQVVWRGRSSRTDRSALPGASRRDRPLSRTPGAGTSGRGGA